MFFITSQNYENYKNIDPIENFLMLMHVPLKTTRQHLLILILSYLYMYVLSKVYCLSFFTKLINLIWIFIILSYLFKIINIKNKFISSFISSILIHIITIFLCSLLLILMKTKINPEKNTSLSYLLTYILIIIMHINLSNSGYKTFFDTI